ncbi:alpha/beta fold hydrolase [Burkholderia cepacia]|uniref:alpha/beta fold hydrolase n=1 Tax=Burkholderia cepacia TaxID=292 RepID=UPI002AB78B60|nr:alpha/beta hydrolase [Burkholderia cepacia]
MIFNNGNVNLSYDVAGDGECVFFIAGTASDRSMWGGVRQALSGKYKTVAFDNRDSGESTICSQPYTMLDLAKDALSVMDAEGLQKAHVVGHSLGGMIAQELAILAPDRISTLSLVNTASGIDNYMRSVIELARDWSKTITDQRLLNRSLYFLSLGSKALDSDLFNQIVDFTSGSQSQPREALIRQWEVDLTIDTTERLSLIKAKTHVIWASEDKIVPKSQQQILVNGISGAKFTCIEESGHCPMIEVPEEFIRVLSGFIDKS